MKQILITTLPILMGCASSVAQSQVQVLSEHHAMQRISGQKNYLMLPVEEAEEGVHVKIIYNNKIVGEFNVRLAANEVNHYVLVDVSVIDGKDALINVDFGDGRNRRHSDVKNYVRWIRIDYTDKIDTINHEARWRSIYHHTPTYGWTNDPNGTLYKDGVWNLYFQYNPYGSTWKNTIWGHSTSTDLVNWTYQGDIIEFDVLGIIFPGSSAVDYKNTVGLGEGAIISYYTSAGQSQTQSMTYSVDNGMTFKKYSDNPILTSNLPDSRDPKVLWNDEASHWNPILAAEQQTNIYSLKNLRDWKLESSFGEGYGSHRGVWGYPDLLKMGDKWFLTCNTNPGGPFGGSATQYSVGSFDGHKFTCESKPEVIKWMDHGKDHYATVFFSSAPDGRIVVLLWMSNQQYANQVSAQQYRSANGLPRELSLFAYKGEDYVCVKPSPEVFAAFEQKLTGSPQSATYLEVTNIKSNAPIVLSNDKSGKVAMVYDEKNRTLSMDRIESGLTDFNNDFKIKTTAPTYGTIKKLQILVDNGSIEVFDADGKMLMANLVFPNKPYDKVLTKGCRVKVYNLKK